MSNHAYLFYAGLQHSELRIWPSGRLFSRPGQLDEEIYNGGYIYVHTVPDVHKAFTKVGWYRCDLTPVLDSDVPKELRTLLLLLT